MPNRFRHSGIGRRGGGKRLSTWVGSADQGFIALAAGGFAINQSNATLIDTTIVRTRGVVSVAPDVWNATEPIVGAIGIGIVSDEALAAGAASIPGLWTDKNWGGWFVWEAYSFMTRFGDATGGQIASVQIPIDSKAMRKVSANESVVVMNESQGTAQTLAWSFRMLVKLP